ncbi:MAG: ABC transporter ATP-binding protein/permease [Oscillospiraceae bacterium]|nr:ABC transporter ATP-binding protein/permease [Oscillospiraceae bacterium]
MDDFVFSLPFNLYNKADKVDGHICVTHDDIFVYIGSEIKESFPIKAYEEYACEQLVGCSMMVGRHDDTDDKCICSFTQDNFIAFAELCKLLNHYLTTGMFIEKSDIDEPKCPKCGLPLDGYTECPYCASKVKVFMKIFKRIGPYKKAFGIAILCTIITEIIEVIKPYINRYIIDDYVIPVQDGTISSGDVNMSGFALLCGFLFITVIITTILDRINLKNSYYVSLNLGQDLRQDVFDKTLDLSMSSVSKKTAGELISRVSNDANKIQSFITDNGKNAIVRILSLVIVAVILFVMNWRLALMVILPLPFVAILVKKIGDIMHKYFSRSWRFSNAHSRLLHDTLNGIRVVKSCGTEKAEAERYEKASGNWAKAATKAEVVWNLLNPISDFVLVIGNYFVVFFGAKMVLGQMPQWGSMTLGELTQFTSYVSMLYTPLRWLIQLPKSIADVSVSASKVFEILEEQTDVRDSSDCVDLDIKGDIEFNHVYFGYKVYNPVLKDISCKLEKGKMYGIVGHSGVGKSTMINLILRLYDVTQGEIKIDGVNIKDISQQSLRSQVGVVLQETYLFEGSVLDNITYAKPDATFEEVVEAAKVAHAHEFITKLPDGYNTRVGSKGYTLSGGERQRVAIARAILHDPKIIILDEATASLDTETERQIQEGLNELCKGRTTIAIAHRLSTLSHADQLIVLNKGRLAEMGTHDELMRNKGVYYSLVMAQRQTTKMKKTPTSTPTTASQPV